MNAVKATAHSDKRAAPAESSERDFVNGERAAA